MEQGDEVYGIFYQTRRQFSNLPTLTFISLKLDIISHECIQWVLYSLRKDKFTPTEKGVLSRIKEAFGLKVNSLLWEHIVESIKVEKGSHR